MMVWHDHQLALTSEERLVDLVAIDRLVQGLADAHVLQWGVGILEPLGQIVGIVEVTTVVREERAQPRHAAFHDAVTLILGLPEKVLRQLATCTSPESSAARRVEGSR